MTRRGLFVCLLGGLLGAPFGGAAAAGRAKGGLRYGEDPHQTIEIHAPRQAQKLPMLVVFGGGELAEARRAARALAGRGFVVALAGLRAMRPSGAVLIADAAAATIWVAGRGKGFGGDAGRLGVLGLGVSADAALMIALDRRYMAGAGQPDLIRAAAALGRASASERLDATLTRPDAYVRADAAPLWLGGRNAAETALAARVEAVGGRARSVVRPDGAGLLDEAAAFLRRELA
ncbi:hypothetical protein [Brevundimonas sp.]|uniref:hypothetical protein n=1 Tax=Brevundimonas sp. TaxID=1871086 RepID=UPI002ED87951